MDSEVVNTPSAPRTRRGGELSYKFQRLRERLRQAVITGELNGKLPGERILAKRYNCNAKTLSKALTDLAAEGLLERSIGRGTYVKGSAPAAEEQRPWLVLGEGTEFEGQLVRQFIKYNPRCQLVVGEPQKRPSFVNQFSGVIDACATTNDSFLRDMVVRGIPVVVVGREPRTYSMDCVMVDAAHGVGRLMRDLLAAGHQRFAAVAPMGRTSVAEALRQSIRRPGLDATADTVMPNEVLTAVSAGVTVLICEGEETANSVLSTLENAGVSVPSQVSVVAVGVTSGVQRCTGCYVPLAEVVENASNLLGDTQSRRPTTLWLAPVFVDRQTTGAPPMMVAEAGTGATARVSL